jgi:hypothetical protein
LEELWLLDLSVSGFVNRLDELLNITLGWGVSSLHVAHGGRDEVINFVLVQAVAVVLIELSENSIDSVSQLLVSVAHLKYQSIINIS